MSVVRGPPGVLEGDPGGPQQKSEQFIFTINPSISNTVTVRITILVTCNGFLHCNKTSKSENTIRWVILGQTLIKWWSLVLFQAKLPN